MTEINCVICGKPVLLWQGGVMHLDDGSVRAARAEDFVITCDGCSEIRPGTYVSNGIRVVNGIRMVENATFRWIGELPEVRASND